MIVRNSQRVPPCSAREPRPVTSTAGRGEGNHTVGRHGPVHSKLSDELREYLANQPRLVLIGVNGTAHLFQHFSFFHNQEIARG
jgi:hypothetical protein